MAKLLFVALFVSTALGACALQPRMYAARTANEACRDLMREAGVPETDTRYDRIANECRRTVDRAEAEGGITLPPAYRTDRPAPAFCNRYADARVGALPRTAHDGAYRELVRKLLRDGCSAKMRSAGK